MDSHEAFLRLFLAHEAELRAFTASLVRDVHVCDDVFQEIALTLWKEFARYDPSRPFGPWARGVAANKVLQNRSKAARGPLLLSDEAVRAIVEAFDRIEPPASGAGPMFEGLRHCLERLPDKSRALVNLRYERELKVTAVAEQIGAGVDAVCRALSRLRRRLQECVRDWLAARGQAPAPVRSNH